MDYRRIRNIRDAIEGISDRCGYENRVGYCSKKKIHIDGSECLGCLCHQDSVTMRKRDWNWTDGYLNEELSE
jgi:hypothetical protein